MKNFIPVLFMAILLIACSPQQEKAPPNIIFIMSDDHASKAISAYDTSLMHTPNIDRLAENGIRFDNCYCTNAICSPSRAVILTGQGFFLDEHGWYDKRFMYDEAHRMPLIIPVAQCGDPTEDRWRTGMAVCG